MKLSQIFAEKRPTLSFEVFPPKTSDTYDSVKFAAEKIASLKPDFMSVTYGAGGGTSKYTADIAEDILTKHDVTPLAHLTCVSSDKKTVENTLFSLKDKKIENILALRGDIPSGFENENREYKYASQLVSDIKKYGDFCVGGACYPEGHPEDLSVADGIKHLKEKVDAGCEFLTTQMFFDNNIYYNFLYRVREKGITVPIIPGIMPITTKKQLARSCALSGTAVPQRFRAIVDYFGDDPAAMQQAGIAYATDQIIDLIANGIHNIHVYSMNKPEVAAGIQKNLSEIIHD